jgi:outer membrane receptor protein involved in Fe transport
MVGNRILILLNGIRLNNATYRYGPNQYLSFIDINQVARIEIVRGAGSVLYGSDAFGGVINVITREAPDPGGGSELGVRMSIRAASADRSGSGRVELTGAAGVFGLYGGISRAGFGDLRAGGSGGTQIGTAYDQWAGDVQFKVGRGPKRSLTFGATRLRQSGVERTDTLQSGSDLEYRWQPEGQDILYARFVEERPIRGVDSIELTTSFQRPVEDLDRISATTPTIEHQSFDSVLSNTLSLQFASSIGRSHKLVYGAEGRSDRAVSRRTDINLANGAATEVAGAYPNGSRFSSLSLFVQDEIHVRSGLDAVVGVRRDWFRLRAKLMNPSVDMIPLESGPRSLTGSAFLHASVSRTFSLVAGVSQGFRAPNIDDSTVLGGAGSRFEVPNGRLEPEQSVAIDYGTRFKCGRAVASVVFFHDRYHDLIDRAPGLFKGLPFLDSNGDSAVVNGFEAESVITLGQNWTWSQNLTWTRGTDSVLNAPLTRIPPLNGVSRLSWKPKPGLWFEWATTAAAPQRRLSAGDKTDLRIGPTGTDGYLVFHLRACIDRGPFTGLALAWQNVTDRQYRRHGSGLDRPGSGVVLGYQRSF